MLTKPEVGMVPVAPSVPSSQSQVLGHSRATSWLIFVVV
jgi:hypothetical protein